MYSLVGMVDGDEGTEPPTQQEPDATSSAVAATSAADPSVVTTSTGTKKKKKGEKSKKKAKAAAAPGSRVEGEENPTLQRTNSSNGHGFDSNWIGRSVGCLFVPM